MNTWKRDVLNFQASLLYINHDILNDKNHEKEAEIVKNAGKLGAVTIVTNMAEVQIYL